MDSRLFHLINSAWTSPTLDVVMPLVTDAKLWVSLLVPLWLLLFFRNRGAMRHLAIGLLFAVGLSDLTSARLLKNFFARQRPCSVEPNPRLLIGMKTSFSFPSSHASNTAAAAWLILLEAGWGWGLPFVLVSGVVGYSRIYVGVHYPMDVGFGFIWGCFTAWMVHRVILRLRFSAIRSGQTQSGGVPGAQEPGASGPPGERIPQETRNTSTKANP